MLTVKIVILCSIKKTDEIDEQFFEDIEGVHTYYSGGSEFAPMMLGVELSTFDEACSTVPVRSIPNTVTEEQLNECRLIQKHFLENPEIPEYLKEQAKKLSPEIFILWSTS